MPPVNLPPDILRTISGLQSQLNALHTQQQYGCIDNELRLRIVMGQQADGTYGLWLYDTGGNVRVKLGDLPNGDEALAYYSLDNDGSYQELFPFTDSYVDGTLTTSSTTLTTVAGSPTLTTTVGQSGDCEITVGSFISQPVAGTARVALVVDGGTPKSILAISSAAGGVAGNLQSTRRYVPWFGTPLAPGPHSFALLYDTSSGVASFSANLLKVQPI